MARRFTLELIMDLASKIGANPAKAVSRSNISFLGKGPTKNPLFQERLAGLENATEANLGKPETLFAAIDDAVGWAKDGKLNSIQTEILGYTLSGINKILNPPVLPSASITPIAPGIEGLRRFPKETHKFFGRPLKDKDFSEIDRMIMEGKIPDARGRTWNLKTPGAGTGAFQGWTPSVVPKANIPASKINHQIIADKYGINVELIRGKDWVEVLEILRKLGRYAHGGLAEILQAPRSGYKRGRVVNPGGYQGEDEGVDSVKHFIMLEQIEKLEKMIASGLDEDGSLQEQVDVLKATPTTGLATGPVEEKEGSMFNPLNWFSKGGLARILEV